MSRGRSRSAFQRLCRCGGALLLAIATLTACAAESGLSRSVLGYEGLGRQIVSYYRGRALERNGLCVMPEMDVILTAEVVAEDSEELVIDIGYSWRDEGALDNERFAPGLITQCIGTSTREFLVRKYPDGHVVVVGMGGPQSG